MSKSNTKTILVVEDHADTAEMLSLILQTEGYHVIRAANAGAAIGILGGPEGSRVSVVLLDLTLPDMNGDEAIRNLRNLHVHVPPTLIMSAKPAASLEDAAFSVGAAGIVRKPFDVQSLLVSIESALDGTSASA